MNETPRRPVAELRADIASAFDRDLDPLATHAPAFDSLDVDPFDLFLVECLESQDPALGTKQAYGRLFTQWREHLSERGRHPACPSEGHVKSFVDYCIRERGNQPDTVRTKLFRLNKAFTYWQEDPAFPHTSSFNPFLLLLSTYDLSRPPGKKPPRIPIEDIAAVVQTIKEIRDRAIVVIQLKLGLRATEVVNLRLEEVSIDDPILDEGYPNLGSAPQLEGRSNAVYVPSKFDRAGNKSRRPRVLPIDEELGALLHIHLLTRPDSGNSWVFQSKTTHQQFNPEDVNRIWTDAFHPEYGETDRYRGVTSHYGRHRFTTYWQVDQPIDRGLVKYMRGDSVEGNEPEREAIDDYIHTYYEDIEEVYRSCIFGLKLGGFFDNSSVDGMFSIDTVI